MIRKVRNQFTLILAIFLVSIIASIFLITLCQVSLAYSNYLSEKALAPISEITTRLHVPRAKLDFDSGNVTLSVLSKFGSGCPLETAIYLHGWNKDETEAREEFNRIQTSLNSDGYKIPLIGSSWNSKVLYPDAIVNAKRNGPDLAEFIVALHNKCQSTDIRLIAHSLGSEVLANALVNLDAGNTNNSKIIQSVHLLGATLNNNLIARDLPLGQAIAHLVDKFYNLYSGEDDGLQFNQQLGNHDPIGLVGAPKGIMLTPNYQDTNVAYELPPFSDADGDGNVEECFEEMKPVLI